MHGHLGLEAFNSRNTIRQKHKDVFELVADVNMYANDVASKTKIDSDNVQELVAGCLYARILNGFDAFVILAQMGLESDSKIILRTLLEILFLMGAICKDEEYAIKYIKNEKANQLTYANVILSDLENIFDKTRLDEIKQRKAILRKEIDEDCIAFFTIENLAKYAGLNPIYQTAYRILSKDVHILPSTLECYLKRDEDNDLKCLDLGPKSESIRNNICAAIGALLHAIDCLLILTKNDRTDESDIFRSKLVSMHKPKKLEWTNITIHAIDAPD